MRSYLTKFRKALWFPVIRILGLIRPRVGSDMAVRFYRRQGMRFEGLPTYIAGSAWFDGSQAYSLITLSEGCNISREVRVLTHDWSPFCVLASLGRTERSSVGRLAPVVVGPHAFIGLGATLLPGSSIGRGAIVGAGAVVRGRVDDYAIVIGNPAKVIGDSRDYVRKRHPDEWGILPGNLGGSTR